MNILMKFNRRIPKALANAMNNNNNNNNNNNYNNNDNFLFHSNIQYA